MSYPPAPWTLQGFALQTVQLVDCDRLHPLLPADLEPLEVLPGMTLGGIYISSYGAGSTLEYNELIVVAGLTRSRDDWGAWISHIYVDNPDSVAGGREIWGLPKELADFTWKGGESGAVTVKQGDRLLCRLRYDWRLPLGRQSMTAPCFGRLDQPTAEGMTSPHLLQFRGTASGRFALRGAQLTVPPESPFANLEIDYPLAVLSCEGLQLTVDAPKSI